MDRVEYQVIGRDVNATSLFRDIANEADRAGREVLQLAVALRALDTKVDLSGINTDIDTSGLSKLELLLRSLADEIDQARNRTAQFSNALDGVDDHRAAISAIRDDFAALPPAINQAGDGVARFGDELATVDDNRAAIGNVGSDFRNVRGDIEASRDSAARFSDAVASVDDHGNAIRNLAGDLRDLNREVANTGGSIDVHQTTDVNHRFADTLKTIQSWRDRLFHAGLAAGQSVLSGFAAAAAVFGGGIAADFAKGIFEKVKSAISSKGGPIGKVIASIIAGGLTVYAASFISTAIGGAILGGLGVGGVIGGLLVAARDQRVKSAAQQTGDAIWAVLGDAASTTFVPAAVKALEIVRLRFEDMGPAIQKLFRQTVQYVEPLTEGLMGGIRNALPGITKAMFNLKPVIDQLVYWMPKMGTAIGNFFQRISEHAPAMARALGLTIGLTRTLLSLFGEIFAGLATVFKWFDILTSGGLDSMKAKKKWYDEQEARIQAGQMQLKGALEQGAAGFNGIEEATQEATAATDAYRQSLIATMKAANAHIGTANAEIAMYDAMDEALARAKEARQKEAYGIDVTTKAGRDNKKALIALADATNSYVQDLIDHNATQAEVDRAMEIGRQKFMEVARQMRINKTTAERLADALFGIPNVDRSVNVETGQANRAITYLKKAISTVRGKTVYINTVLRLSGPKSSQGEYIPGVGLIPKNASGGPIYGPGPKGVDSQLRLLAPGEHVLTAREVDAAGGQQAITAFRKSLLGGRSPAVANEYGSRWSSGPSGMDEGRFAGALRRALSGMTLVIDDRSGRSAQLIARGG